MLVYLIVKYYQFLIHNAPVNEPSAERSAVTYNINHVINGISNNTNFAIIFFFHLNIKEVIEVIKDSKRKHSDMKLTVSELPAN